MSRQKEELRFSVTTVKDTIEKGIKVYKPTILALFGKPRGVTGREWLYKFPHINDGMELSLEVRFGFSEHCANILYEELGEDYFTISGVYSPKVVKEGV